MTQFLRTSRRVWPWLIGLLPLLCLLAAPFYLLACQQPLLAVIDWALGEFTDVHVVWVEPAIDIYGGEVSAREFHLVTQHGVPLVSLYEPFVSTRISDVLTLDFEHSSLDANVAVLYLPVSDEEGDGEIADILSYLALLPQQLKLERGYLIVHDEPVWVVELDGLEGHRVADDSYLIDTDPVYLGDPLSAVIELKAVTAEERVTALLFDAQITEPESTTEFGLSGELQSPGNELWYDLRLNSRYKDISVFLRGLDAPEKLAGSLGLSGRVRGDLGGFHLTDVSAQLDNLPAYAFTASGELEYRLVGDSRLAIEARGEFQSVESLLPWVDAGSGEFGRAEAKLSLSGPLDNPVVDAFELQTRNDQGLEISLSGQMASLWEAASRSGDNKLHVAAAAPGLAALEPWLGEMPWELGAWRAECDLEEVGEKISLDNVLISAGFEGTLAITARGSIANVARVMEEEIAGLENIDLEFSIASADASSLASWFAYEPLAGHTLDARLRLQGEGADLATEGGEIRLEGDDLVVGTKEVLLRLDLLAEDPLLEFRAPLFVHLSDTSALSKYIEADVPSLGALSAEIGLRYADGHLSAEVVDFGIRGKQLQLSAQGDVADVLAVEGIDLRATLAVEDPDLLENLTGLRMAPGTGALNLAADARGAQLRADLHIGDTPLDLRAAARFAGGAVAGLDLKLASERLQLKDIGLQSSATADNQYSPAERIGEKSETLSLESVLQSLPTYPLNLQLRLDRVSGESMDLTTFELDAEGEAGRYTLRRLAADAGEASIEFVGVIDSKYSPPAISLAGQALGVPTGTIANDLGMDADFEGTVTMSGGLIAYGDTGEQLVHSLDGHFAIAVKDSVIEGAAYDVLLTDLLGWVYKGAAMESRTQIDCSMADFSVRKGVATSDRLYIETDRMVASGTVEVDLVKEHLDLTLTPLSKSRAFQVGSAVRVKGPFSDLQPGISPISAAADAYTAWLTLVPQITLEIFGYEGKAGKQQPCRIWRKNDD